MMAVTGGVGDDQGGEGRSDWRRRGVGDPHLATPLDPSGRLGSGGATGARHQDMDFAASLAAAATVLRVAALEGGVVVFGDDEMDISDHPASFLSLLTSSATSATLTPALRLGGSETRG